MASAESESVGESVKKAIGGPFKKAADFASKILGTSDGTSKTVNIVTPKESEYSREARAKATAAATASFAPPPARSAEAAKSQRQARVQAKFGTKGE